jgi:DNA-binding NarL/FixJ family response regulator
MPRNSIEAISATEPITTESTGRLGNDAAHATAPLAAPLAERNLRAMFMGRPCMAFDCICEAISICGIEADFRSVNDQITRPSWNYDVFVMFLRKCEPGVPALIQRRMSELRACMPRIPTMALLDDANVDAATLYELGFSTIIMGLPSLNFAVTAMRLLSRGAENLPLIDGASSPVAAGRQRPDFNQANHVATTRAEISFTKRELDLIDLLRSGKPNKLIAHRLDISESTVKAHLHNIMIKLHAKNRTHAVCMLAGDLDRRQDSISA